MSEMYTRRLRALKVGDHEAVTVMTVEEFLELTVPGRAFLPRAKNEPLTRRIVEDMRDLHDLIQRDLIGQKLKNARTDLPRYIIEEWLPDNDGDASIGVMGAFMVVTPTPLEWLEDDTCLGLRAGQKFIIEDGESRGESFLWLLEQHDVDSELVEQMLEKKITVVIHHGVKNEIARKWFADVNGKGIGVNANLIVARDITDRFRDVALAVFADLGVELEEDARQVRAAGPEIFTVLQARLAVTAIAKGPGAVGYGAGRIPPNDIDFDLLTDAARKWFSYVFNTLTISAFKDREQVLRSVPVLAAIGAVGRPYYAERAKQQRIAREQIADARIDWATGEHWNGICGKVNPNTGRFSVGSAKEYGNAVYNALTDVDSRPWRQIRKESVPVAA